MGNRSSYPNPGYDQQVCPANKHQSSYYGQIQYDISYYLNSWFVSPGKIILGLMPGKDDMNRDLALQDALNLTSFAANVNLQGVMIWDANIDSTGVDGNAPYAYSMGIQSILNKSSR